MNNSELRQKRQLEFLKSGEELSVGDVEALPLTIEELTEIDDNSPYVVKVIKSGLTAIIYKIKVEGICYNLKRKRKDILVKNVDGQTSFLNEVQRRKDFYELQKTTPQLKQGIAETVYASLHKGFILSRWIEGDLISQFNEEIYESIFSTIYYLECNGIFEWDMCHGNMLVNTDNKVKLFDFGYCYKYNPLTEYNSDGLAAPLFHCAERLETRTLFQYFMDIEDKCDIEKAVREYRIEKLIALKYYNMKLSWLESNGGDKAIKIWVKDHINKWEKALSSNDELNRLYRLEAFRSYVLDVHDDIGGKSCTVNTIKKADKIISIIEDTYTELKKNEGFFFGDEKLARKELIDKYKNYKELVIKYQI